MVKVRFWLNAVATAFLLASAGVMGGQQVQPILPPVAVPQNVPEIPIRLLVVGDIVWPNTPSTPTYWETVGEWVLAQVENDPTLWVILLGDICNYEQLGRECYERFERSAWGRISKSRIITVMGNHDKLVEGGRVYLQTFPSSPGKTGLGYQGVNLGEFWRLLTINSEADAPAERLEQGAWLREEMKQYHKSRCLIAAMHRPPYSSGQFASPRARLYTGTFYDFGGDVLLAAHDHLFDWIPFVKPLPNGPGEPRVELDRSRGINILIQGTGGSYPFHRSQLGRPRYEAHGEVVVTGITGVTRLSLWKARFEWEFVRLDSTVYRSGGGNCHENPTN